MVQVHREEGALIDERLSGLEVVFADGEVDLAVAPSLDAEIAAAVAQGSGAVIDLSGTTFLDSVALGVLAAAQRRFGQAGLPLYLVVSERRVLKVFEITGLSSTFSIFPSRDALVAHLAAGVYER